MVVQVFEQPLQGRAVQVAARIGGVVIMLLKYKPAFCGLGLDIRLTGLALGVERIELKLKTVLGRFPGIDGTPEQLFRVTDHGAYSLSARRPKNFGPFQRLPVISRAM